MKIAGQQKYAICNIISCVLMLILGLNQSINCLDKGLFFVLDLLFTIVFLVLDIKKKFFNHTKDYYLAVTQLIMQIIEIEMLIQTTEKGIFVFILLKLQALIQILEVQPLKNLTFSIVFVYSLVRFQEYNHPISYIGIVYLPNIIYLQKVDNSNLLEFLREVLPISLLVIDKETQQPIYNSKALESDFKYDLSHSKEFVECLNNFFSKNKIKLRTLFDNAQSLIYKPQHAFRTILTEIMDSCQYFAQSPIFQKFSGFQAEDDERENKLQQLQFSSHQEIIIDTPKYQYQCSKPSIQISEETPKNQKSKIMEELLIRTESQRSICITQLKKKTLKIYFNHCFWENRQAFLIILENKDIEKCISKQISQLEDYKQQCENKDLLLATVFHDFKTPINGIMTILENLGCRDDINNLGKYYLNIIRKNVNLMLYMIYDIQDYARIQKNQLRLCLSDFYINEIIEEVIENFVLSAEQKEVEIITEYDLPTYQMHSDPNRIKQILMNIISNSLKFTEKGKIIIKVLSLQSDRNENIKRSNSSKNIKYESCQPSISQIRKSLQGKHQIIQQKSITYTISIEDTGCGIADSIKPQLFNLFATFSTQKIENKSGTGIGLMVCKKLVGLLGPSDEIDLWSQQGVGTKMTFKIFARLQDDPYRSPNYIGCFKQEKSSQHISGVQNDGSADGKEKQNPVFVRSSMLRIYTKPLDKAETDTIEPSVEDGDHTKSKNILLFQSLSQKINNQKTLFQQDSQEVHDPKYKLQQTLLNKKFGVLIVDDQTFNVLAFKMLLRDLVPQLNILEAYNGQQAINKIIENQKQLNIKYVFMDLHMPIVNGWQAAERIRKMIDNQEIENVKLVALSGFDDDAEQERCGKLGFDAFIPKPIKLEMIAEIFSQLEREF